MAIPISKEFPVAGVGFEDDSLVKETSKVVSSPTGKFPAPLVDNPKPDASTVHNMKARLFVGAPFGKL